MASDNTKAKMNRRDFLKTTGAAAGTAAVGSSALAEPVMAADDTEDGKAYLYEGVFEKYSDTSSSPSSEYYGGRFSTQELETVDYSASPDNDYHHNLLTSTIFATYDSVDRIDTELTSLVNKDRLYMYSMMKEDGMKAFNDESLSLSEVITTTYDGGKEVIARYEESLINRLSNQAIQLGEIDEPHLGENNMFTRDVLHPADSTIVSEANTIEDFFVSINTISFKYELINGDLVDAVQAEVSVQAADTHPTQAGENEDFAVLDYNGNDTSDYPLSDLEILYPPSVYYYQNISDDIEGVDDPVEVGDILPDDASDGGSTVINVSSFSAWDSISSLDTDAENFANEFVSSLDTTFERGEINIEEALDSREIARNAITAANQTSRSIYLAALANNMGYDTTEIQNIMEFDYKKIQKTPLENWASYIFSITESSSWIRTVEVYEDVVYIGFASTLKGFDIESGDVVFDHTVADSVQSMAVADGVVYAGLLNNTLVGVDIESGSTVFEHSKHTDKVTAVTVSDGVVYSGSGDNTVKGVDISTGETVFEETGYAGSLTSIYVYEGVVYSADLPSNVKGVDLNDNSVVLNHTKHTGNVYSVHVYDGVVYSGSGDNTVKGVNISDGTLAFEHTEHTNVVNDIYVSDGVVYSASDDNSVKGVNISDSSVVFEHTEHTDSVQAVTISKDIVYSGTNNGELIGYDSYDINTDGYRLDGSGNLVYEADKTYNGYIYSMEANFEDVFGETIAVGDVYHTPVANMDVANEISIDLYALLEKTDDSGETYTSNEQLDGRVEIVSLTNQNTGESVDETKTKDKDANTFQTSDTTDLQAQLDAYDKLLAEYKTALEEARTQDGIEDDSTDGGAGGTYGLVALVVAILIGVLSLIKPDI